VNAFSRAPTSKKAGSAGTGYGGLDKGTGRGGSANR
jgi:hypothetical protein